jgi:hypothetical protein
VKQKEGILTELNLMNGQGMSGTVFGRVYRVDPVLCCPVASSTIHIVFFKDVLY